MLQEGARGRERGREEIKSLSDISSLHSDEPNKYITDDITEPSSDPSP